MDLKRSNVEFSKRVFLDRLTVDDQGVADKLRPDNGPGNDYEYGGVFNPFNLGVGADCSGIAGTAISAALYGSGMQWARFFSTESFPGPFAGFKKVGKATLLQSNSPIKVAIMHGGGGPNSHMNIEIDGVLMESSGSYGVCTTGSGAIPQNSNFWNAWWIYDGKIIEDTTWRQPMEYLQGVDYAGGRISGADLKKAGVKFVCRYLTDGGKQLPGKQLLANEFDDLMKNDIAVVFNWETTANFMLGGAAQAERDAATALNYIRSLPGAPQHPVVYFSADWDATPAQQVPINAYLAKAAEILGGPDKVGIYGGYWPLSRALNAGVCKYAWQTEAWSGGNVDSRINIMQRNRLGYKYIAGIPCDVNEAHTDDFGQWPSVLGSINPGGNVPDLDADGLPANFPNNRKLLAYIAEQIMGPWDPDKQKFMGWPQNGQNANGDNLYLNDLCVKIEHNTSPEPTTSKK